MTKAHAIKLFGSGSALAKAIGRTRSAISQWPEKLTQRQADLVTGAAIRLGKLTMSCVEKPCGATAGKRKKSAEEPSGRSGR